MLQCNSYFEPPESRARIAMREGLVWSLGEMIRMPGSAWAVLTTIVAAVPLYALHYHAGSYPILGFWLAIVLGAVAAGAAMGVMVATLMRQSKSLAMVGVALQMRSLPAVSVGFGVTWTLVILGWRELAALEVVPEREITEYLVNSWASPWKPLAHVGAFAMVHLALMPFAALSVPAIAASGSPIGPTMAYIRWALHHKMYNAFALGFWLLSLAMTALVPWAGLLAVPIGCLLLVRIFQHSFARRENWPPS